VRARILAAAAAVWTIAYAIVYLVVISGQGNSPAAWYVVMLAIGAVSLVVAAAGRAMRPALIFGTIVLGIATLLGLLSIGLLLLPALIASAVAIAL
jgi:hypothetical protein